MIEKHEAELYAAMDAGKEEMLDSTVREYAENMRKQCTEELRQLTQMQKMWQPILDTQFYRYRNSTDTEAGNR